MFLFPIDVNCRAQYPLDCCEDCSAHVRFTKRTLIILVCRLVERPRRKWVSSILSKFMRDLSRDGRFNITRACGCILSKLRSFQNWQRATCLEVAFDYSSSRALARRYVSRRTNTRLRRRLLPFSWWMRPNVLSKVWRSSRLMTSGLAGECLRGSPASLGTDECVDNHLGRGVHDVRNPHLLVSMNYSHHSRASNPDDSIETEPS